MTAAVLLVGVIVTLFGAYCALRSVHRRPKRTKDDLPPDRIVGDIVYRAFRIPATATVEAFTDALDLTIEEAASWDPKTEPVPPAIRARQQERYRNWLRARKGRPSRVQGLDDGEAPKLTARPARVRPVSPITTASKRVQLPGTQPRRRSSRPPLKTVGHYPLGGVRPMPNFIIGDAPGVERWCSCGFSHCGSAEEVEERWQAHLHADERTFGSKAADRVFAWLEKHQERVEGRAASVNKARSLLKTTSLLSVLFFLALSIDAGRGGRWNHDFKDPLIRSIAEAARSVGATSSTITGSAAGGNWTAGGAWVGGVAPTSADDVLLTAASGNINAPGATTIACRSLDCTGYTGTFTWLSSTSVLNIGDASGGSCKFVSTMTIAYSGAVSTINFLATTGSTTYSFASGGRLVPSLTINGGTTTTIQFADAVTTAAGGIVTLTQGKLDTNSLSVNCASFASNSGSTRSLTLDTSTITVTGTGTPWDLRTSTGLTLSAASSSITLSGATAIFNHGGTAGAAGTYGLVSFTGSGTATCSAANCTFTNLTRTGTAVKGDIFTLSGGNVTVTNALTLAGASTQGVNRLLVQSAAVGTTRTFTVGSVVINGDVDFSDIAITYSGGASWTNTGAAYVGDAGGNNSTVTTNRTAPANQTATGTASFTWSTHGWTSRVPLPQDSVFIPNAFVAGRTITIDMPRLGANIDFTSGSGSPILSFLVSTTIFGSLTLVSGITTSGTVGLTCAGRSSSTLTTAGCTLTPQLNVSAPGGTLTLQDALSLNRNGQEIGVLNGTFADGGFSITLSGASASYAQSGGSLTSTGNWSIAATASAVFWSVTGGTITHTGSITLTAPSANNRVFAGGGKTYGTLTYTVANSPGNLAITNAPNTFNTINIGPGRSWTITALNTQNVTNLNANGSANGYLYLPGIAANYVSTPDTAALSITGDIDIRCKVALDSWTPASTQTILAKWDVSQQSYRLLVNTTGTIALVLSSTGSNTLANNPSTAATGLANGALKWIRATRASGTGNTNFYTSDDGSAWAQLGATVAGASGAMFDSSAALELGTQNAGTLNTMIGKFYKADVRNNILDDGTGIQLSADFTTKKLLANTFVEGSANAATMTINGTLAQQGDGRVTFSSGTPASQATLATTAGADLIGNVIQDIAATPSKAVYALDSTDGGNNSGIFFMPPDVTPQDRQPALGRVLVGAVRRAARW